MSTLWGHGRVNTKHQKRQVTRVEFKIHEKNACLISGQDITPGSQQQMLEIQSAVKKGGDSYLLVNLGLSAFLGIIYLGSVSPEKSITLINDPKRPAGFGLMTLRCREGNSSEAF